MDQRPGLFPRGLDWRVIGPVALLAAAVVAVLWLDIAKGGEAVPAPPLGAIGTPVRGTFVAPTAGPSAVRTARARPTATGPGTPAERDARRRNDLLILLDAAVRLRARDGSLPSTTGNVQTVCGYKDIDAACKLRDILGTAPPVDPSGDPIQGGYWYSSDGQSAKFYAALEGDISDADRCSTNDVELNKRANVICVATP